MGYVENCKKHGQYKGDYCGECIDALYEENARLKEALEFTIEAAEYLYRPNKPLQAGLSPTFYHTLSYEGDLVLIEKTKKARAALEVK